MFSLSPSSVAGKLCLLLLFFVLGCQPEEPVNPEPNHSDQVIVETINANEDAQFLELIEPLNHTNKKNQRILDQNLAENTTVKKVSGDGYINYTIALPEYEGKPGAYYSMIVNSKPNQGGAFCFTGVNTCRGVAWLYAKLHRIYHSLQD